ncbi:AUGMIN subunit 3-like [Quercus lobata]|uniref:AUGMIN subunit 3-like n=1 Tax=Quercus lobata TaxID=97700 RepID=UPI0012449513|nr:AUGMIN subunit 3-like [Quercus lobata]
MQARNHGFTFFFLLQQNQNGFGTFGGIEDLDFAFDDNSISAFSARPGRKHFLALKKDIGVAILAYKAEALELQKQLRHIQSQFDMHTGQALSLIQGRRARVAATSTLDGHLTDLDDSLSARNLEWTTLGRRWYLKLLGYARICCILEVHEHS